LRLFEAEKAQFSTVDFKKWERLRVRQGNATIKPAFLLGINLWPPKTPN
jgi:hypothetical protein